MLILNLVLAFFSFVYNQWKNKPSLLVPPISAIFLVSIPILYFVHIFLSGIPDVASFHFEKKMGMIAAPLLFYFIHQSRESIQVNTFLKLYAGSSLILAITTIGIFFYGLSIYDDSIGTLAFQIRTLNESLTQLHPTYLGLHLIAASFITLYLYHKREFKSYSYLLIICTIILIAGAALSGARSPFIGLFIGMFFYVFASKLYSKKAKIGVSLALLILPIILIQIPVIGDRFQGIIEIAQFNFFSENAADTTVRFAVLWCDLGLIRENWLLGVGTGEIQYHLNLCYQMIESETALTQDLNTHNEYANIWIGTGIIGILLFLGFYITSWIRFKHWLPKIFLILFGMVCLTENLLERQQGVFFVALLFSLFIFHELDQPTK